MTETLTLAFVPGVTPAKWVGVWKERMPATPIELLPLSESEALDSLRGGHATVALLREPFDRAGLNAIPLYEERAVVVAPKDHAIAAFDELDLSDLAGETIHDLPAADAVEVVAANVGIAVMPQSVARLHSRRDVIARPLRDAPTTRISLAWPEDAAGDLVEEFIGIVRGRTANSSRGAPTPPAEKPPKKAAAPKKAVNRSTTKRRR